MDPKAFEQLPTFFEGNSRILKQAPDATRLICKLKPTVFSIEANGPVIVLGIDKVRTQLNAQLCSLLHRFGIRTSTLDTCGEYIMMSKQEVPPIEVVVKAALVGTPKHIYNGIEQSLTRSKTLLGRKHAPYVRFDWRNPFPQQDQCLPDRLADHFIDTAQASKTALRAYEILKEHYQEHDLDLLDICFFMNTAGTVICAEVSTDNCRLAYAGIDPELKAIFASQDKNMSLERAQAVLRLLEGR